MRLRNELCHCYFVVIEFVVIVLVLLISDTMQIIIIITVLLITQTEWKAARTVRSYISLKFMGCVCGPQNYVHFLFTDNIVIGRKGAFQVGHGS